MQSLEETLALMVLAPMASGRRGEASDRREPDSERGLPGKGHGIESNGPIALIQVLGKTWALLLRATRLAKMPTTHGVRLDALPPPLHKGEDLVAKWKRKCPLAKVCTGEIKGTTTRFVKKAVGDSEGDIANRLRNYYKLAMLCTELTKERLPKLPAGELRAIVAKLQGELTFPDCVKVGLLDHAIARLIDANDFAGLIAVITPWCGDDTDFDPLAPTVVASPLPMAKKLEKYRVALFGKLVPALIGGGSLARRSCAHSANTSWSGTRGWISSRWGLDVWRHVPRL